MLLVACGGLAVTLIGVALLYGGAKESLNVRGAFLEVMGDLLGSIGTIVAAVIILNSGWAAADTIISALIGVFIIPRAWALLRSVMEVLLEATPRHLDMPRIEAAMRAEPGVESVHDLHAWTITNGFDSMSGHVRSNGRPSEEVLHDLRSMLRDRFGIDHVTLQVESADTPTTARAASPTPVASFLQQSDCPPERNTRTRASSVASASGSGSLRPPAPFAAPLASSLRAHFRGDPRVRAAALTRRFTPCAFASSARC